MRQSANWTKVQYRASGAARVHLQPP